LTGSQKADEIRETIYTLYLKGFNVREIAKAVALPKSNVAYHLSIIRKQNTAWFDKNVDPEGRRRALTKELADQIGETILESWILYDMALTCLKDVLKTDKDPAGAFGICNSYIRTILSSLQQYRLCLQVVAPSMDDVSLHDMMDKLGKEQEEIRMKMKVIGLPPQSMCWEYQGTKFIYVLDSQWEDRSVGGLGSPQGTKFIYVLDSQWEDRSVGGLGSPQGSGGAYITASKGPMSHCIIIPSRSTEPSPYEKWARLAGYGLQMSSAGKFLPTQVSDVTFPLKSRYALRPPAEYIKSRIRKTCELYPRAGSVTNELDVGLVTALANTSLGADADYQPAYHPISRDDIIFELESTKRNGEVHIEGMKVDFSDKRSSSDSSS